ncbi:hypothetical protein GFL91_14555 [Rhizobium leguminosarum bv. viciae]|uniref:Twin-arginine translocation signal domain-containing protein n=1 Tax=Rhizobium leguminosarum bv. viciae TaxID=387 RepID=A0A8I2KFU7_RHILV|nr:hypothetical protein [Rhizobium leguminosarum]MBY5635262.1 hypothetical protein [Rhizobium leguminosarum]NKM46182.1 hypothetical protein [Rhizobium leguminosarum bv. viciae]UFW82033.1 hypothetical protein RlegSU303_29425 [Rhizobium leguminosarum bv. viciae]
MTSADMPKPVSQAASWKRRTFLKGASVASALPALARSRHAEAIKAADMLAGKSNAPNLSGTRTSSIPLHPSMTAIALRTGSSAAASPMFHHHQSRYFHRRATTWTLIAFETETRLSPVDKELFWRRQFLNPYAFEGARAALRALVDRAAGIAAPSIGY